MNATERTALLEAASAYEELRAGVSLRTLEIVDRRRRTAVVRRRGWLVRRLLLVADLLGLTLAFLTAQVLSATASWTAAATATNGELALFAAALPVWVVLAKLYGLYDNDEERTNHSTVDELVGVFHTVTIGAWMFFVAVITTSAAVPNLAELISFWALGVAYVVFARAGARALARRRPAYLQNAVIVGAGTVGQLVAHKLLQHPEYGVNLVGFVDGDPTPVRDGLEHVAQLGPPDRLAAIVRLFDIERVVIAFSNERHDETLDLIRSLKDLDIQIDIVPRLFEIVGPQVGIHTIEGVPLIGLRPLNLSSSSRLLKRAMDVAVSLAGLLVLSPLFLVVAWRVKHDSPGPVFFRQERIGAGDRPFRIFKFRTMVADAEERKADVVHLNMHVGGDPRMFKIPDDPRVTKVGRFLRRYSLDELPQLLNVLRGEMSLVGPRPLILDEDRCVATWARRRLDLKPGATGLWQVLGASDIPFEEMTKLDYLYVTNWTLWGDVRLIFRTIPAVLRARQAH